MSKFVFLGKSVLNKYFITYLIGGELHPRRSAVDLERIDDVRNRRAQLGQERGARLRAAGIVMSDQEFAEAVVMSDKEFAEAIVMSDKEFAEAIVPGARGARRQLLGSAPLRVRVLRAAPRA